MDVFLQPGEYHVGSNCRVRTLLGSCVSIVLWHAERRTGAMCHFLLASRSRRSLALLDARYADEAIPLMVRGLRAQGVLAKECTAKLFGGGNMFPGHTRPSHQNIGEENGRAALELMQAMNVPVVATNLFGDGHRQILFEVNTGNVWVKHVTAGEYP